MNIRTSGCYNFKMVLFTLCPVEVIWSAINDAKKRWIREFVSYTFYTGALASGASYSKETHELIFSWLSWLAVLLLDAYARLRRRRRSRATWRSYSDREMQPWFIVYFSDIDIHVMINWHLSKQGSAGQYRVTLSRVHSSSSSCVFFKLTNCWFFDWIAGSCLINFLKTWQDCSEGGQPLTRD